MAPFFVVLPGYAFFRRVALVVSCFFQLFQLPQLAPAIGRESGAEPRGEAVAFSCLFQLSTARGRGPCRAIEGLVKSWARSLWDFLFRPMLSLFHLTLFHLTLFLFHLMLSRVRRAPLCVEQVAVQRLNFLWYIELQNFEETEICSNWL